MDSRPGKASAGLGPLRLLMQDAEDLTVASAVLQDSIAHVGDIRYEPQKRRLTVLFNRYRWESNCAGGPCERVYTALQLGDVATVKHKGMASSDRGALVSCLAIDFEPGEAPGGVVLLRFCHGGDLRVEVDCVDAVLADVCEPWPAVRAPAHEPALEA